MSSISYLNSPAQFTLSSFLTISICVSQTRVQRWWAWNLVPLWLCPIVRGGFQGNSHSLFYTFDHFGGGTEYNDLHVLTWLSLSPAGVDSVPVSPSIKQWPLNSLNNKGWRLGGSVGRGMFLLWSHGILGYCIWHDYYKSSNLKKYIIIAILIYPDERFKLVPLSTWRHYSSAPSKPNMVLLKDSEGCVVRFSRLKPLC